ncbi:MAG TPA: DUF6531 domain-containing protein, partial [Burkholderiales bacterium]|nr:DUF6531 domain-containing protein [Burkholderiales bacterium]
MTTPRHAVSSSLHFMYARTIVWSAVLITTLFIAPAQAQLQAPAAASRPLAGSGVEIFLGGQVYIGDTCQAACESGYGYYAGGDSCIAGGVYQCSPAHLPCPVGYQIDPSDMFSCAPAMLSLTLTSGEPGKEMGLPAQCIGNVCDPATGNKYREDVDYLGAGPFPLRFARYFNTLSWDFWSEFDAVRGRVGPNWRSTYDRNLTPFSAAGANWMSYSRQDGSRWLLTQSQGAWQADPDLVVTVQPGASGSGWTLRNANDELESYDANGRLVSITNRAGLRQTLSYDGTGHVISVQDPVGRTLSFTYDWFGRIATVTDPAGGVYSYTYDDSLFSLVSVTYPDGSVVSYVYDEPENMGGSSLLYGLTGVIDENGQRLATYSYDDQGRVIGTQLAAGAESITLQYLSDTSTAVTDGLQTTRLYDAQTVLGVKRNTNITQPCPGCTTAASGSTRTYDQNGNVASVTDFNGNLSCYSYDLTRNLQTRRVEGLSGANCPGTPVAGATRTITTQWDATFRLPHRIAEPLRIKTFTYDVRGTLTSKTIQATNDADGSQGFNASANGSAQTWTYTNTYSSVTPGLLIRQVVAGPRTDVANVTTYVWDESGNLISVTNALGQTSTLSNYDAHGRAQQVTDPNGLVTTLAYDVRGRLISRNVGGELTSYAYDPAGQLIQVTAPDGSWLAYTYDAAHRLIQVQDNLGDQIVYSLDAMGNRVQVQVLDANGTLAAASASAYDALNRLAQSIGGANPATEVTSYGYDAQGNLTSVSDPLGHLTSNLYDALNRLIRVVNPGASGTASGGSTQYLYDGLDQVTQVIDPRNLATRYSLDGLGNLTQLQSPDSGLTRSSYDAAGNLVSQTDARGVTASFTYDALNRLTQAVYAPPAGSSIAAVTLLYGYDQGAFGIGHLTGMSDPSGTTRYSYDQHGRLIQDQHSVAGASYTLSYSYDSSGRLSRITYPSGRTLNYGLDALGRIRQIDTSYRGTSQSVVSNVAYQPFGAVVRFSFGNAQGYGRSYDLDGRVTGYNLGASSRTLSYDAASRLTSVSTPNAALNQSYGYD